MDFPYIQFNKFTKRPIIPIIVKNEDKAIKYDVLVDSGADYNLFHAEIAEVIGIKVKKGKPSKFYGVGAEKGLHAWIHTVGLFVPGEGTILVPVAFSYDISDKGHGLLGQLGFFDNFVVRFDNRENKVSVKLKGPKPS